MRKKLLVTGLLITCLGLSACGGSESPSGSQYENIDEVEATAHCGMMGGLITGDMPITADTYEEVMEGLEMLSEKGVGEVKNTATFMLSVIDGEEHSESEAEKVTERFKDFCSNYTVD